MLSYETLDAIADAYNPLLALIALAFIARSLFQSQWKVSGIRLMAFIMIAIVAYGLMFLDHQYHLWGYWELDYSTHSAVALGLVLLLSFISPRFVMLWTISFVGYALLMLYQRYHTVPDILTTGIVVSIPTILALKGLQRLQKESHKL
jgi:hypothetical protein